MLLLSDVLKLQFVESGVPKALSEMIRGLQGGSDPHDLCSIKIGSNLIVSLLLGGKELKLTWRHQNPFTVLPFNLTLCVHASLTHTHHFTVYQLTSQNMTQM